MPASESRDKLVNGQQDPDEPSLFDPDLAVYPPGRQDMDGTDYTDEARQIRRTLQTAILNWLKSSDVDELETISALTRDLQELARLKEVARLWWIAGAYLEMLAKDPAGEKAALRYIPARLDQLLRKLIDEGEAALVGGPEVALVREMLFEIRKSSCRSELLTEIRQAFCLDGSRLGEVNVAQEEEAEPDHSVIRSFTRETLSHLGTIRDCLNTPGAVVSPELQRTVHVLSGTSRSLHLVEMSNFFHSLEEHLARLHVAGGVLSRIQYSVLDQAAVLSAKVLERLNSDRTFPAVLREEFDLLLEKLEDDGGAGALSQVELPAMPDAGWFPRTGSGNRTDSGDDQATNREGGDPVDVDDLQVVFVDESTDVLRRIDKGLSAWQGGADPAAVVAGMKRDLHTLKGSAYAAGFEVLGDLSHQTETLLQQHGNGLEIGSEELLLLLEEAHDSLYEMVSRIGRGVQVPEPVHLKARLSELIDSDERDDQAGDGAGDIVVDVSNGGTVEQNDPAAAEPGTGHELLRINSSLLDRLVNYAGELSVTRAQLQEHLGTLRSNLGELRQNVEQFDGQLRQLQIHADSKMRSDRNGPVSEGEDGSASGTGFDPLQMERHTVPQQLAQGLTESLDDLTTIQTGIARIVHDSETVLQQQAQLGMELQDGLMSTRLVPFSTILPGLRHQARQSGRELGKSVELRMTGGEVQIDRKVLEGISDALDHMIRNAVDHGIELPGVRESRGKPAVGCILVECKSRGSEVVVRIGDDGGGLNLDTIREKAVDQGLMGSADVLTEQRIIQVIVLPGFSTAAEVTQHSGRGVGMDAVHDAVRRLGGSLEVESQLGCGVVFEISLPVSLSITQAIFVRCGRQEFAIPLNFVKAAMKADSGKILPSADGRPLFEKDGEIYPLLDLPRHLDLAHAAVEERRAAILIVRMGATGVAVKVSELLGTREVVVKTPGRHIAGVQGIAGATIRGDGRVIIILDLAGIWAADERAAVESPGAVAAEDAPLVMVVDDSLTVRKITAQNLSRHGMEVVMAKDGVDALEKIAQRRPDLMLVDIEMPRMDGYELTRRVKSDPVTGRIPIVMITSRAGTTHQEKAMSLGADDYLVKPYQEQELFTHVERALAAYGFRYPVR